MSVVARLGGVALSTAPGQTHAWSLQSGSRPFQRVFVMTKKRAKRVFKLGRPRGLGGFVESQTRTRVRQRHLKQLVKGGRLVFELLPDKGRPGVRIRGLYALSLLPGPDQRTLGVLVADRRWLWNRTIIERAYNVRRRTGERRLLSGEVVPAQIAQRTPDYTYRRITLKDNLRPWTPKEVLEDILTKLCGPGGFVFDAEPRLADSIESLELHDPGPDALDRVLAYLPGTGLYAGSDGLIHVINTLDRSEARVVKAAPRPRWGTGDWREVDLSSVRPRGVDVYLDREHELRFNLVVKGQSSNLVTQVRQGTRARGRQDAREELELEMVLPVTDEFLDVDGKRHYLGTWLDYDRWLRGVQAKGDKHSKLPDLTDEIIRRWYLPGFSWLHRVYSVDAGGAANPIWSRRLNAVQDHWRWTVRIVSRWMDKIRSIRAVRAAVLDQETGTRARADAFFDHTVKPSFRALWKRGGSARGFEVTDYAENLKDARPSPAEVTLLDDQAGIIRLQPRTDLEGTGVAIAPGHLDGPMPVSTAARAVVLWNSKEVKLKKEWNLAIVLSCVPDAPNNEGRLWREKVTPAQAARLLPGVTSVGASLGPTWEVFAGEETARFAWRDEQADAIKEAFYSGKLPPRDLMVNPDTVQAVARAQAARIYSVLLDRVQGQFRTRQVRDAKPTGNLQTVTHGVRWDGSKTDLYTEWVLPTVSVPPSVFSLMPEGARKILRRLVE